MLSRADFARRTRLGGLVATFGVVTTFLLASNTLAFPALAGPASATVVNTKLQDFDSHIDHIVFLLQENHAYDNYFGTYCQATGTYCPYVANGIPAGTCVPMYPSTPSRGCVKPYNFTKKDLLTQDITHDWNSTHNAINGGKMNGFYAAEGSNNLTFGHYNGTTIPVEWDLAEQYSLADDFFSSAASYSLPNHWYEVSVQAPQVTFNNTIDVSTTTVHTYDTYLNESNATTTIETRLDAHRNVTWKYYDFPLYAYNQSTVPVEGSQAWNYFAPLAADALSYKQGNHANFVSRSDFFNDSKNGTLPDISWVIASVPDDEHPSTNISTGESWVASVVDAIESSPEWNSTVLFVSWDEYGGFYDHVVPPVVDGDGDGLRVPMLAISPYSLQGYIDGQQMDFSSILHLMEDRFGLKCLGARDCNAALPLGMFNFNHKPRKPIYFAPYHNATYPMALQSSGMLPPYGVAGGGNGYVPLVASMYDNTIPDTPNVDWS